MPCRSSAAASSTTTTRPRSPIGKLIEGGYLSLQSESHPIDFRKVALLNLAGCMDRKASNYRAYYVKSEPAACKYAGPAATP